MTTPPVDVAAIESLTRRAEAATAPETFEPTHGDSIVVRVVRNDETIEARNFERWLEYPVRPRGTATLHDPIDFTAYINRLRHNGTTVWGDEQRDRFTAVFNDHEASDIEGNVPAGWRDHTAVLQLQPDPDWQAFLAADGNYSSQLEFGEFLQDYVAAFVEPDGATLLEVATSFKAHRKAEFSSAVDLDTGDLQLTYNEETSAKTTRTGQIEVPRQFVVQLSPFLGYPPVKLQARLRWFIDSGQLRMGFKLHRPDLVKRQAFADIRATIADRIGTTDSVSYAVPVLLGPAPGPVNPQT